MAGVTCVCGRAFEAGELLCARCRRPKPKVRATQHRVEPSADTMSEPQSLPVPARSPADDSPATSAAQAAPATHTCDHAAARPGATNCPDCGTVLGAGGWTIEFPWGTHRVEPGEKLEIGREVGPYADQLDAFETVSRRHAEISCTPRGQLLLIDEHSTNLTFRNGTAIVAGQKVELAAGDQIGFSLSCRAVIRED